MRWEHGFSCSGEEFDSFWIALAAETERTRRGLFIGCRGFDPRTTTGPLAIAGAQFPIAACCLIRLTNPQGSRDQHRSEEAARHEATMRDLFRNAEFHSEPIAVRDANGRLVGSSRVRTSFADRNWLNSFTDVIVDVTALPTSVSFPLLGTLISIRDALDRENNAAFNLHCIVCENIELDETIVSEGGDQAEFIDPFRGRGGRAAEPDPITIWAPVLGEGQSATLRKIYEMLGPAEVKPFPAVPFAQPAARRRPGGRVPFTIV